MPLRRDYGYTNVLSERSVAHDADAFNTRVIPVHAYSEIVITYDAIIDFSGGSSPGLTFTVEGDVSGEGEWIALATLVTTDNGYVTAAPANPTITSTGKNYKRYGGLAGMRLRIKVEVAGTPASGTATINNIYLIARR